MIVLRDKKTKKQKQKQNHYFNIAIIMKGNAYGF